MILLSTSYRDLQPTISMYRQFSRNTPWRSLQPPAVASSAGRRVGGHQPLMDWFNEAKSSAVVQWFLWEPRCRKAAMAL